MGASRSAGALHKSHSHFFGTIAEDGIHSATISQPFTHNLTLCHLPPLSNSRTTMSDDDSSVGGRQIVASVPRLQNGPPQTSTSELAEGIARWMEASSSFVYVELASLVLMFACVADWQSTVWYKYAVSVACVSLIICLILQTGEFLVPGFLEWMVVKPQEDGSGGHNIQKICSVFLLLWWIFGCGIITFKGEIDTICAFICISNCGGQSAWGLSAGCITLRFYLVQYL